MKNVVLLLVIIFILLFSSCQKTPESETVRQKDNDKLMEIIKKDGNNNEGIKINNEDITQITRWDEHFSLLGDKVKVDIKADVIVPQEIKYPVIMVEPDKFSIEHFLSVEKLFFPECKLISRNAPQTKEEIEQLIFMYEKSINDPKSDFNTAIYSEEEYQSKLQEKQSAKEHYKDLYNAAPYSSEIEPIIINTELLYDNEFDLIAKAISNNNELKAYVFMNANNYENKRINCIDLSIFYRNPEDFSHWVTRKPREDSEYEILLPPKLEIRREEAIKKATDAIEALEIKDMDLNYCYKLLRGDSEAYELYFTKTYRGIPSNYAQNGSEYSEYTFDYRPEEIHIRVNDDGIITFKWTSPSKLVEVLNENVELLPYEEIQEIARKQLQYRFAWKEDEDAVEEKRVNIETIKLGMMRVSVPNSINEYMVIPVWDFYGHFIEVYPPKMAEELQYNINENGELLVPRYNTYELGTSLFTINAIDGSIIHRYEKH